MNNLSAKMTARLNKYRSSTNENGFSMLEAVVVVGVLIALAVTGFIAYGQIIDNARTAAVESAASSVYTAAVASVIDGDATTDIATVVSQYNDSQEKITVTYTGGEGTSGEDLVVTATDDKNADKFATRGIAPSAPVAG